MLCSGTQHPPGKQSNPRGLTRHGCCLYQSSVQGNWRTSTRRHGFPVTQFPLKRDTAVFRVCLLQPVRSGVLNLASSQATDGAVITGPRVTARELGKCAVPCAGAKGADPGGMHSAAFRGEAVAVVLCALALLG